MDLSKYKKADLFLAAMKAEVESQKMYRALARKADNQLLKDKLLFIADEEEKHQKHIERMYRKETGARIVRLPRKDPVPHLAMEPPSGSMTPVKILAIAAEAEKAATEFYESFSAMFSPESDEAFLLSYFASMERGHWTLFDNELRFLRNANRPVAIEPL